MKYSHLYIYFAAVIQITGCIDVKPPEAELKTFSGYIYEDCGMEPSANQYVDLFQDYEMGLINDYGGVLASGYTDSNGYFKLEFNSEGTGSIHLRAGGNVMDAIPWNVQSSEVVVYRHPTCNIQVSLNVINAYEEGDTLTITDFDFATPEGLKVPCPLSSGILYTAIIFHC